MERKSATNGKMEKSDDFGWIVNFENENGEHDFLQLHPDDVESLENASMVFDNMEARLLSSPEVQFTVFRHQKMDGVAKYAKLVKEN